MNVVMDKIVTGNGILERLLDLVIPVGVGVIVYGIMLIVLKVDVVIDIIKKILKKEG